MAPACREAERPCFAAVAEPPHADRSVRGGWIDAVSELDRNPYRAVIGCTGRSGIPASRVMAKLPKGTPVRDEGRMNSKILGAVAAVALLAACAKQEQQ